MKHLQVAVWSMIASVFLSLLVLAITKIWLLGYHPFRVCFRVDALANAVTRLSSIRDDIIERDPHPSSHVSITWRQSVVDLEGMNKEIKDGYDGCVLNCFKWCYIGMRAGEELDNARELTAAGISLWNKVCAGPRVIDAPPKKPQHPSEELLELCKIKVLDFISEEGAMYGLLGIWGLSDTGNTCLLTKVQNFRSKFDGGDASFLVIHVKAGKGCTQGGLKEAIGKAMVPAIESDTLNDHLKDKSFVLLIDDLWDSFDLKEVGIPQLEDLPGVQPLHKRKVVFTTSTIGVCVGMGCHNNRIVELKCSNDVDDSPGMMAPYMKVLDFIKSNIKYGKLRIWGMGGVGKSTLLDLVHCYRPVFDGHTSLLVLYVKAGKESTVAKVQKAIVDACKLEKTCDENSQSTIIWDHLKDKSFLLLLDDLRANIELKNVGIPELEHLPGVQPLHQRKVVFTTRSYEVCCEIKCPDVNSFELRMECLSEEEAWVLFQRVVGARILKDDRIAELAREMVEEFAGLPKALCKIGQVMSTKREPAEWETAIDLLKNSKLLKIIDSNGVLEDLFRCLEWSYLNMTSDMKEYFLIYSLHPGNENIPVDDLIKCWKGLDLLNVPNASRRGCSIIQQLLKLSMLEEGDTGSHSAENRHVKIHSMIRKMALWIANDRADDKYKWLPHSPRRSAQQVSEDEWCKVEKAWVSEVDTSTWCKEVNQSSTTELTLLVARDVSSLKLISWFRLLTFLDLEGTKTKIPFEVIGALSELQHLNLSATETVDLTKEVGNLTNLKYLYIRHNKHLKTIAEGLIRGLKKLQGFDLFCTGAISSNFSSLLNELANRDLTMLGFTVQTKADITALGKLKGVRTQALCMHHFEVESDSKIINLEPLSGLENLRELAITESSVHQIDSPNDIQSNRQNDNQTENQNDIHSNSQNDNQTDSQNQSVVELVAEGGHQWQLTCLEIFKLNNLHMLERVTWINAGRSIRMVSIYDCKKLRDATWVHQLQFLEQLTIARCEEMEIIINVSSVLGMDQTAMSFPRLKSIYLKELPNLSMISDRACQFKELSYVCVDQCNTLGAILIKPCDNQNTIRIDCSSDWWTITPYFIPRFCF